MNDRHLSQKEQEAYVLGEKTPEQARHMSVCTVCRAGVAHVEYGVARFRQSSLQWAEECMEARLGSAPKPETARARAVVRLPAFHLGWVGAALLAAFIFFLHPWATPIPAHPVPSAALSDDALLEQVDAQLAAGVPDAMHSLTHLVSANSSGGGGTRHE